MNINEVFIEKYRPKEFDEFVFNDKKSINDILIDAVKKMPHLLLISKSPGTGKTTLGKLIIKKLNADFLELNASDKIGIDEISKRVKSFASTLATNTNSPKIVFLDEADYLGGATSKAAQMSLRVTMEKYMKNCRFILTANDETKIIEPIKSRCRIIRFEYPDKDEIFKRLKQICENEKIKYDDEALKIILNKEYPDIRSMIQIIDELNFGGDIVIDRLYKNDEIKRDLYEKVLNGKLFEARKIWIEKGMDCRDLLQTFFEYFIINSNYNKSIKGLLIDLFALYDGRMGSSATPDIQLTSLCKKIYLVINKQKINVNEE